MAGSSVTAIRTKNLNLTVKREAHNFPSLWQAQQNLSPLGQVPLTGSLFPGHMHFPVSPVSFFNSIPSGHKQTYWPWGFPRHRWEHRVLDWLLQGFVPSWIPWANTYKNKDSIYHAEIYTSQIIISSYLQGRSQTEHYSGSTWHRMDVLKPYTVNANLTMLHDHSFFKHH
jgi:hypothetical protein